MAKKSISKRNFIRSNYQGKVRLYVRVTELRNVSQLWEWDAKKKKYGVPTVGRKFEARRYEVESFREYTYPMRSHSTCLQYDKLHKLHFGYFLPLRVTEITPQRIDHWLRSLKRKAAESEKRTQRVGFATFDLVKGCRRKDLY